MAKASYEQTSFIGGEVSPLAQGRSDLPWYRQAMTLSLNGVTVEEGAWVRRSGFEFIVPTRGRTYGKMIAFDGSATCSFAMVFTDDNLQFVTQSSLIFDNTVATITANDTFPAVTLDTAQADWIVGDQVMVVFPDVSSPLYPLPASGLRNRLLTIGVKTDSTHFSLYDDLGAGQPTTIINSGDLVGAQVMRVLNIATAYSGISTLQNLRAVQIEYQSVILSLGTAPQVVQITTQGTLSTDPTFSFEPLVFVDGPYLDPSGDTGSVSALTGTVTFTASTTAPFAATDVGRHLRLFSQPALWDAGHAYSIGDNVTDSTGAWWTAILANTGVAPGTPTTSGGVQQLAWAPAPTAGSWAWGKIATYSSASVVSVALDTSIPDMVLQTGNGDTITLFQLGVFSNTPAPGTLTPCFPTCGLWEQGRLWLAGALLNRFDTTVSNGINQGIATFSPTDPWDNVLDSSGISETLNSSFVADIQWMIAEDAGVLMGSLNGEFLIFSSATNDPITPTNIDSRMITKFGGAFIEPVRAGMATIFVQKFQRRAIEYLSDAFSGKFSGRHLNEWAKHLATAGIAQLAYQEETWPCVWAMMNNGLLTGCTYRRFSRFVSEAPNLEAWHRVLHGRQRSFTSMCVVPGKGGLLDRLFVVTNDPVSLNQPPVDNYYIEIMQPLFDEGMTSLEGWFCDEAPGPGPGNSGYDCGGGNASIFPTTGGVSGADSSTPDVSSLFPYDGAGVPVGDDLSANLVTQEASFLDGMTCLYMLPPFPSAAAPADKTSLSMSVWVARQDFPQQTGALFSSPALTSAEANAGTRAAKTNVSCLLAGPGSGADNAQALAVASSGLDGQLVEGGRAASISDAGQISLDGQIWQHVMISAMSNGDGSITVTAAMNETVLVSSQISSGIMDSEHDMWPFATQPGAQKDVGLCVWCIGGTLAALPGYTITHNYASGAPTPYVIPTLAQIIQSLFQNIPIGEQGLPPWYNTGPRGALTFGSANLSALPAYLSYIQNLASQQSSQSQDVVIGESISGGQGNIPVEGSLGGYSGYRGSVAELLIWPGVFIDWTNADNRAVLHWFDTVSDKYKPLSVGPSGGGTALGQPYVYLSGPPSLFNINRAASKPYSLVVVGTGITESPLNPPGND